MPSLSSIFIHLTFFTFIFQSNSVALSDPPKRSSTFNKTQISFDQPTKHIIGDHEIENLRRPPTTGRPILPRNSLRSAVNVSDSAAQNITTYTACIPELTNGSSTEDHVAHAVPGVYQPYTDMDDDGFIDIELDGSASHSHFFDVNNGVYGRITSYTWTLTDTDEVISNEVKFVHRFAMGVTEIKLRVIDNSCSVHEAQTEITVTGKMKNGQYCYFYNNLTLPDFIAPMNKTMKTPFAAGPFPSLSLNSTDFLSMVPRNESFVVKCLFEVQHPEPQSTLTVTMDTNDSGIALYLNGTGYAIPTLHSTEFQSDFVSGANPVEMIYIYSTFVIVDPYISITFSSIDLPTSYDQSAVLPVISDVNPATVKPIGGTKVHIKGFGIEQPFSVYFGDIEANVSEYFSNAEVSVYAPPMTAEYVNVSVLSQGGRESQRMLFKYSEDACDPVKFEVKYLHRNVTVIENETSTVTTTPMASILFPTCVMLGPDNRLYIGSLGGTLHTVGYNGVTLEARTYCHSEPFKDPRFLDVNGSLSQFDILGVAFNPIDEELLPYVSTSSLFQSRGKIDSSNDEWWRNGGVHRYKYISDPEQFTFHAETNARICLEYDRAIVRNLPVSARDHGVNALLFTPDGNLLISVGGFTNMGLPSVEMGGTWESVLSGAVLVANTSMGLDNFDGIITYSSTDVVNSTQLSGDIETYATGFRNLYTMTMTQNGSIFAVDQGPNCGFGRSATSCSVNESVVTNSTSNSTRIVMTPTSMNSFDPCPKNIKGTGRADKILQLEQGLFYGHANVQRGECEWIDPFTGMSATGNSAPVEYKAPVSMIKSSVTGINEYRATHFCNELQGQLIMTDLQGKKVWNLGPSNEVETLAEGQGAGGIQFVEDMHGNLIFLQLYNDTVNFNVLQPVVTVKESMKAVGSWPRKVPKSGGARLFIGGWGFNSSVSVMVGNSTCAVEGEAISETKITCIVPEFTNATDGSNLNDLIVEQEGDKSVINDALLYIL